MLAVSEGPSTAPKIAADFLSSDFHDDFDLGVPGSRFVSKGVKAYLHNAMGRQHPQVVEELVPLWATRTQLGKGCMETSVERDVLIVGERVVRVEYLVRHAQQLSGQDRVCRRRTTVVGAAKQTSGRPSREAANDETRDASTKRKGPQLRDSFAKLDADGSGHLSIAEIINAASLVGLRFDEHDLQKQLLTQDHDGDGTFELDELDSVLKKDQLLETIGLERFDRPLLFDVLPLIARTFDAHAAVETCMKSAEEREHAILLEARRGRASAARELARSSNVTAVKKAARHAALRPAQRRLRPRPLVEAEVPAELQVARRAATQSTVELAQMVESFEEQVALASEAQTQDLQLDCVAAALDEACVAANSQRAKLAAPLNTMGVRPPRHHQLPRSQSKPAFERPRRPHALPPLTAEGAMLPKARSAAQLPSRAR
jgi:hypothetical protein